MKRIWFVTNPHSGSTTPEKCEALETVIESHELTRVGRTDFPDDELPSAADLEAHRVDTVVLFAGDGTINSTLCALSDWGGGFLILPGGTMNMLARELHDSLDPQAIIEAAKDSDRKVALPTIETEGHRAFVGLILGPGASWVRAREAARSRRPLRMLQAMRLAWQRTFGHRVHVRGVTGLNDGVQAVFVRPLDDALRVRAVEARDWGSIAELGWDWLTGDWVAASAVTEAQSERLILAGTRPSLALFDGEPVTLAPGTEIYPGHTRRGFISTKAPA